MATNLLISPTNTPDAVRGCARSEPSSLYVRNPRTGATYLRGKLLGKGGFARCYELIDLSTNKVFACKIISRSRLSKPHQREKIIREIKLHQRLKNQFVVDLVEYFEDDGSIYIIMEFCQQKSLMELLKGGRTLPEVEAKVLFRQMLRGVNFLHSRLLIHRDLKLGNMLLTADNKIKIGDFGLATQLRTPTERKLTVCGTPNYIAPEILQKRGYSLSVDIWALGCVLYAMLVGKPPFETESLNQTYSRINSCTYSVPVHVSSSAKSVIDWCLQPDPAARPSPEQLLSHEFLNETRSISSPIRASVSSLTSPRFAIGQRLSQHTPKAFVYEMPLEACLENIRMSDSSLEKEVERTISSGSSEKRSSDTSDILVNNDVFTDLTPPEVPQPTATVFKPFANIASNKRAVGQKLSQHRPKSLLYSDDFELSIQPPSVPSTSTGQANGEQPNIGHVTPRKRTESPDSQHELGDSGVGPESTHTEQEQVITTKTHSKDRVLGDRGSSSSVTPPRSALVSSSSRSNRNKYDEINGSRVICQLLDVCLSHMKTGESNPKAVLGEDVLWVTKWVDYSNKYGFALQLSDRSVSVMFNDGVRLTRTPDARYVQLNERGHTTYTRDTVPQSLVEHVELLDYFRSYMSEHLMRGGDARDASRDLLVSLTSYKRTDSAILMVLNNGNVQVNRLDNHTKLIVSKQHEQYIVTHIDGKRRTSHYRLLDLQRYGCSTLIYSHLCLAKTLLQSIYKES